MSARDLIKKYEGLRLKAYPDPATGGAPWTIGYGHTYRVKQGDVCTKEQAEQWLSEDLQDAYAIVDDFVKVKLSPNQRDALVSFVFNIGAGRKGVKDGFVTLKVGRPSSLLTKLNQGDFNAAAEEILKWDNAAGKKMTGLTKRRREERELFLSEVKQEKNVSIASSILISALPSLVSALPEIANIFKKTDVAERNVEAVAKVGTILMQATGATNMQEAVERVQADPQTAKEANDALRTNRADLVDLMERMMDKDEASVAAARVTSRGDKPILGQWQFIHLISLFLASLGGFAALLVLGTSQDPTERVMALQTLLIVGFASVASFWLGSSRSSQVKDLINQDK